MTKHLIPLLIILTLLAACTNPTAAPTADLRPTTAPSTPTPIPPTVGGQPSTVITPTPLAPGASPVLISEILAGVQGNNNYEFIELYNRSAAIVDLQGWALWYRLPSSAEDLIVYRWRTSTLIPPQGHLLLVQAGQDVGVMADGEYEQALNPFNGGLQLRNTGGDVLDTVGWAKSQDDFFEGTLAPGMENGISLERQPGGAGGSAMDTNDNAADFALNASPDPQNTGSPLTPKVANYLEVSVSAPESAAPGGQFVYAVTVANHTGQNVNNVTVTLPIPPDLTIESLPEDIAAGDKNVLTWTIPYLGPDASLSTEIAVVTPWTYFTAVLTGYYAQAADWAMPGFGAPVHTAIEGGVIPIGTARTLTRAELTVEGIATMYTGGYYAGSGGVKFYLQDDTGGIQVYVDGGEGTVRVKIGDRVRVRGQVQVYRGAVELVPIAVPDDVTVLERSAADFPPETGATPAAIVAARTGADDLPGRLVTVEGAVTRVQEFSYSYEIDLADETGQVLTLYVDKQTPIVVERIEEGQRFRATGILEVRDTSVQLYPRVQADLTEIFPPILRLTADGPITAAAGGLVTYTLVVYNHTTDPLTNIAVTAMQPVGTSIASVDDGGLREGAAATWTVAELPPNGGSVRLHFTVAVAPDAGGQIVLDSVTALGWTETVSAAAVRTFIGDTVPIWAIQGDGFRSPFAFDEVTTEGIVTGVFRDLSGFFVQETASDDDPLTSPGVFISTGANAITVQPGDTVRVTGVVREQSQQTAILLSEATVLAQGGTLPIPVDLDPPTSTAKAAVYFEALEGTLVQVNGAALAVSPTTKYGEYAVVLPEHGVSRLYQGDDNGIMIMVDDGANIVHADRTTMAYAVASGDTLTGLIGPLAFTYEQYKIEPIALPNLQPSNLQPATIQPATSGQFSLMTWNVENLFDNQAPNPTDPPMPSKAEYEIQLEKVANTILAAGAPTIIALQEVENIGVLESIAAQEQLAAYQYKPVLIEGHDSRGIDVGYLIRGDRAKVLDVQQRDAPEGITSRPPLIVKIEVTTDNGPATVYVINNHFTSMSGGEASTESVRTAQAAWNVTLVAEILADDPEAYIAVVGDLNSYFLARPIQTLREGGLVHVFDACPGGVGADPSVCPSNERPYTYIYQGQAQVLDHILVTPSLMEKVVRVDVLHINADYPLPYPDDTSPAHKSDHDPVVVTFGV